MTARSDTDRVAEAKALVEHMEYSYPTYVTDTIRDLLAVIEAQRGALNIALGALGDIHDGEPEFTEPDELKWCRKRAEHADKSARAALGETP